MCSRYVIARRNIGPIAPLNSEIDRKKGTTPAHSGPVGRHRCSVAGRDRRRRWHGRGASSRLHLAHEAATRPEPHPLPPGLSAATAPIVAPGVVKPHPLPVRALDGLPGIAAVGAEEEP